MKIEKRSTVMPEKIDRSNSHEVKQSILNLLEEGTKYVEVDFTNVKRIDSLGLGTLLVLQNKMKENNVKFRLINVHNKSIQTMFNAVQLYNVIDYETG